MVAVTTAEVAPFLPFTKRTMDCPVCGGNRDDPAHKGIRCRGGMREGEERYAWCSREEHAGPLTPNANGYYRHFLAGPCHCGAIHPGAPAIHAVAPVRPRPPARSGPPKPITRPARLYHGELGTPARDFEVRRRGDRALMALHARFEWPVEGHAKPDKTYRFWRTGWSLDDIAVEDLPLYNAPALDDAPADCPVWLVEGQMAQEALQAAFTAARLSAVVLATYGATAIPSDDQLRDLVGHTVTLWSDRDDAGDGWRDALTAKLTALGISVRVCVWPDAPPKGDAVEYFGAGGTVADLVALTAPATLGNTETDVTQATPAGEPKSTLISTPDGETLRAQLREADAELRYTLDLAANTSLDGNVRWVQWKVQHDLRVWRRQCRARGESEDTPMPICLQDSGPDDGQDVRRPGWGHGAGLSKGTAGKHLHLLERAGGVRLSTHTTWEPAMRKGKETTERRDHIALVPALHTFAGARTLVNPLAPQKERGGARANAGRKPKVCATPGCESTSFVVRTFQEWECSQCGEIVREEIAPAKIVAGDADDGAEIKVDSLQREREEIKVDFAHPTADDIRLAQVTPATLRHVLELRPGEHVADYARRLAPYRISEPHAQRLYYGPHDHGAYVEGWVQRVRPRIPASGTAAAATNLFMQPTFAAEASNA
jgi:hypothetical protein